jgi:hypothetical protein
MYQHDHQILQGLYVHFVAYKEVHISKRKRLQQSGLQIRNQLSGLLGIRIQLLKMVQIHSDPDPQHCVDNLS